MGEENSKNNINNNNINKLDHIENKTENNNNNNIIKTEPTSNEKGQSLMENIGKTFESSIQRNEAEPISEEASKYRNYLKMLYKNNFVSLTFDDLCAFIIQFRWRKYFIRELRENQRGIIDVIYTSLNTDNNNESHNDIVFNFLNVNKYGYRCYDLMTYKNLYNFLTKINANNNLPAIFINGYYIGSYYEFQGLIDENIIPKLLEKEYNKICLSCNVNRTNQDLDTCPFCFRKYTYFALTGDYYNIWDIRHKEDF